MKQDLHVGWSQRRRLLLAGGAVLLAGAAPGSAWSGMARPRSGAPDWNRAGVEAPGELVIAVHRSEGCSCCKLWLEHLDRHGLRIEDHLLSGSDLTARRRELGVPDELASCHTAVIEGYVIEGHVPADDIKRLVIERPEAIGLAVPGMPIGSPGMEVGSRRDPFTVVLFSTDARIAFRRYHEE